MTEDDLKNNIKYLLNSHHELIKALQKNNKGLEEMNILIRGLIAAILEKKYES